MRVNPETGRVVGTPFLPPVRPGDDVKWKQPAIIGGDYFAIAAGKQVFLIDASNQTVLKQVGEMATEGGVKSDLVAASDRVFAVVAGKPTDKLISIMASKSGLQAGASADLGGLALAGPWVIGSDVLVRKGDNSLACFDANLNAKWSVDLGAGMLGEDPMLADGAIRLVFSDGRLQRLDPGTGQVVAEQDLGQPVIFGPVKSGSGTVFAGRDGTIHNAELSN